MAHILNSTMTTCKLNKALGSLHEGIAIFRDTSYALRISILKMSNGWDTSGGVVYCMTSFLKNDLFWLL